MTAAGRSGIRVQVRGSGAASVETGLPVLDRLLERLAHYARFDLTLEVEPGAAEVEVAEAGSALGRALADVLRGSDATGYGFASMTSSEALASVVLEVSEEPLVVSNVDLTSTRAGGLRADLAATFLDELADAAGLTIHVRLLEGEDSRHVLSAMFKALVIALAQATKGER